MNCTGKDSGADLKHGAEGLLNLVAQPSPPLAIQKQTRKNMIRKRNKTGNSPKKNSDAGLKHGGAEGWLHPRRTTKFLFYY
jgi:hypothetical protein